MKFRLLLVVLLISVASWGQFNINAFATNYTQDFNTLTSGTWTDNSTLTGWYARTDNTASITAYGANTGGTVAGGLYAFGVAGTNPLSERALGMASSNAFTGGSGTGKGYYGWRLRNNTGAAISAITITWTGEQWRKDNNAASHTLNLFYRTGTNVTDIFLGSWTPAPSTFTTLITGATTAAALDGNASANRTANITVTINVLIPANEEIMLRWEDLNDSGNDHLMAIDDVTITAAPVCTPPSDPTGSITGTTPACNSTTISFSGSASAPVVNYWQTSATGQSLVLGSAASPLTANTIGTTNYYVRAFNSSTSCWSTNSVGPYAVTVNAVPTFTTNPPVGVTISEGTNYDYVVTTSSLGSYQWQVDTGSGFNNVANGGVYSGATTATLSITGATIGMNGYRYRCGVLASAPCVGGAFSSAGTLTVLSVTDNKSDLFYVAGSSPATISSTMNDAANLTSTTGVQAMQFLLRDGGSTFTDTDNLPTILTGFTISQVTNTATDWSAAIKTIALFDGTTRVANGVISASTIVFSGLTVSTLTDGGSKTLSLRMSLNCPLGTVIDGEYFGFSISNVNTTVAATGSSTMTTFAAIQNSPATGGTLRIAVVATRLLFTIQPTTTGVNNTMTTVVVKATDACGNVDVNFTGNVSLISSGTMTVVAPVAAVAGVATFSNIVHTATGTNLFLTASSTVTAAVSTPLFDIVPVTVLKPGDVAVLAVNTTNASGDDEISFVSFVDITPGTRIDITDNAFQKCGTTNGWGISEGWMRLERKNTTLTKGTIITITVNNSTGLATIASPDPLNWISSKPQPSLQGVFNLNPGGEQVFFMAGGSVGGTNGSSATSDAGTYSGNFLFGFNTKGNVWTPFCANAAGGGTTNSDKPLNFDCFLSWPTSQSDYNKYTGPMTDATQRDWVSRISDSANWTGYANNAAYIAGPNFYGASINILNGSYSNGVWIGDKNTDWFDCSNWQSRKVPDSTVDVIVGANATQGVVVDIASPNALAFSYLATCNDLTISDYTVTIEASTSNVLEVHGDLAISSSGVLDMDDGTALADGIIKISGDWTNDAGDTAFSEGNGTVEFVGSSAQIINSNVHTNPEVFYNVVLDNDFNTTISNNLIATGDLEVKTNKFVTIGSAAFPNDYIRVNNRLTNNGDVIIETGGQLIQVNEPDINNGDYSGTKFTLKRAYTARDIDYVYWSAPTKLFAVSNLPNGYRYEWDPVFPNSNGTFGNWIAPSTANMTDGKGYIARTFNGSSTPATNTFTFRGQPNNGEISIPIYRENIQGLITDPPLSYPVVGSTTKWDDNWNLVGNPYPSAINSLTFLLNTNNPDIEGFVYVWSHGTVPSAAIADPFYDDFAINYTSDDYIIYNGTGTVDGPSGFNGMIASGQGFFVLMKDGPAASGMVNFNNSMRRDTTTNATYNNTQFYRSALETQTEVGDEEKSRIWLDIVSPQNAIKRTLIGYVETASNEKDRLFDAVTKPNSLDIYSFIASDAVQEYCIQGRALPFSNSDYVALGIKVGVAGNYKITISAVDGLFEQGQPIFLEDKLLNIIHDLRVAPYSFTTAAGRFDDRFILRYTDSTLGNQDIETINNSVVVATNQGELTIKSYLENMQDVTVYDILGRQLFEAKGISNTEFIASNISMSKQTLIVKIKLENGVVVTRKILL